MNIPRCTRILEFRSESVNMKTILFSYPGSVEPGQFYMIWIPGVDEIPMSVSYIADDIKGITFRTIGEATTCLFKLKQGDAIGVRGPYGKGFKVEGKRLMFVGGGTGTAMLAPAIELAGRKNIDSIVVLGAKTKDELLFESRLRECSTILHVSTDDGSAGYHGVATDVAQQVLAKEQLDGVLTCGPEAMMKTLFEQCSAIPFQASLERYMKCAIGLCGQCCMGEGFRVCIDGPVVDGKTLKKLKDFGVFKRDATGRKQLL